MNLNWVRAHWKFFTAIVMVSGLIWIGLTAWQTKNPTQGMIPAPREGFLAPDFDLPNLQGEQVSLHNSRGKVVVLNLWTTWCAFCKIEMPAIQRTYQSLPPDSEVVIITINSTVQDNLTQVRQFAQEYGLTFPILLDTSGRTTQAYQVRALPTTFFIDREGVIQNVTIGGPLTEAMLQAQISTLLARGN